MPQLPDNLQDLMRMAERLGEDAVDKKEPSDERDQPRWARKTTRGKSAKNTKKTNMCTKNSSPSPTMRQTEESQSDGRPVSRPKTKMCALGAVKRAT